MSSRRKLLREAGAALEAASSYAEWLEAAEAHDRASGALAWREEDASNHYDTDGLRQSLEALAAARAAGDAFAMAGLLTEHLYRHLNDVTAPELYEPALAGTKLLVGRYLDEAEACLRWLSSVEGVPRQVLLEGFERAWKVFGRSALLLSGGATWGFHHLGVVKALLDLGLLPHILSGASTGAMIAAGACSRTDDELRDMFAHPEQLRLDGLMPLGPREVWREGSWLDPARLYAVLRHNVGDWTFAEAFARSGRALNISVSPTRHRQKPRLLSHLTSPDVLVASAALASSALPGLFPPVVLERRAPNGSIVPHVADERWVDGSIAGDLPKLRLSRLHNVNHFIVSQTNPHVLPFVWHHGQTGLRPLMAGLVGASVRTQGAFATDLARRVTRRAPGPVAHITEHAHALVQQDYRGDIDIHPQFRWGLLSRVVTNPTAADLATFIREGERAVWPRVAMIRDQTRIGRAFKECVERLAEDPGSRRPRDAGGPTPA